MIETIDKWMQVFVDTVWGLPTFALLVGCGLFFTIYLGGIQFRYLWHAVDVILGSYDRDTDPGEVTHFRALCSALSATVGLGNIAGVAIAISVGGPGAAFWLILTGFLGMVTKCVEATLAVRYRHIDENGVVHGGPMHYIELGLGKRAKFLAVLYSVFVIFASFGAVSLFQTNQIAAIMHASFGVPKVLVGIILFFLTGIVIIGGIKRIGLVASRLVPLMACLYVGGAAIVLVMNFAQIPEMVSLIISGAFSGTAAVGAFAGVAVKKVLITGVQRACFSNEAGLGTAAIAHAAAKTDQPVREGVVAMLEPFIDTVVICSMTAFVVVSSGLWKENYEGGMRGVTLTADAFNLAIPHFGSLFIPVAVFLFGYSTLISWYYYGERAMDYLFEESSVIYYKIVYVGLIVLGSIWSLNTIVNFMDGVVGLMIIPNVIALLLMAPRVRTMMREYFRKLKAGEFPRYR